MTDIAKLADRLIVVSRADYVLVSDEEPTLLNDDRVTVVPIPLLGAWYEIAELRTADLSPGDTLVRDPDSGQLVSAAIARDNLARSKVRLLHRICQLLGAHSLQVIDQDDRSEQLTMTNTFKAGGSGTVGKQTRKSAHRLQQEREFAATVGNEVRQELRTLVESHGSWTGGTPDITGALRLVEQHGNDIDPEIRTLIEMRGHGGNTLDRYRVSIDMYRELHRHFSLLAELNTKFEVVVGKHSAAGSAYLSNNFTRDHIATQHGRLEFDVWFTAYPTVTAAGWIRPTA